MMPCYGKVGRPELENGGPSLKIADHSFFIVYQGGFVSMFDEKNPMFQELTDEDLDQVAGGAGVFGGLVGSVLNTVNGTVSNATTTATSTSLPHATGGVNVDAQTPVGSVNLSLGTDLGL